MSNEKAPIFKNWDVYYELLPIRKVDNLPPLKLCECAFWVNDEDLEAMAQRLEKLPNKARASVVYITAPSCSGKTASVLPAFLKSVKSQRQRRFTHYLYLAFANNGENRFQVTDTSVISESSEQMAMCQGAEFMLTCMTRMLLLKRASAFEITATSKVGMTDSEMDELDIFRPIDINPLPRREGEPRAELKMVLDRYFVGTLDHPRLLVHIDEHQQMTGPSKESRSVKKFADFRRGAIQLLADEPRMKCVATYTEVLSIFPPDASSAVCREPCPMPVFDIWKFEKEEKTLGLDRYKLKVEGNREVQRTWATLLFRLSAKCGDGSVLRNYHVCKTSGKGLDNHFAGIFKLRSAENDYDVNKMLSMEELTLSELNTPKGSLTYSEAVKLTAGIDESSDEINEKFHIGITLVRNVIVGDWLALSRFRFQSNERTTGCYGYMLAREALKDCLLSADVQDVFAGSPLESAYAWSLFASLADTGGPLQIGRSFLKFEASHYNKARLFSGSAAYTGCMVHPNSLDRNTLDKARELERENSFEDMPTKCLLPLDSTGEKLISSNEPVPYYFRAAHPLCDIFFVTDDNCLVMIDVTASASNIVDKKATRMGTWIATYFDRRSPTAFDSNNERAYSCQGIALAPFCSNRSNVVNGVNCVRGQDARRLLGALDQIFRWFAPPPQKDTTEFNDASV